MDEIAKYHSVIIYHLNEYESGLNPKYISYIPRRAVVKCVTKENIIGKRKYDNKKIIMEKADIYILDGYGFWGQQLLIIELAIKKIPFVMSIDGGIINYKENYIKKYLKTFFISKAKAYFSTSKETDNYIRYYGGKTKPIFRHYFSGFTNDYIEEHPANLVEKEQLKKELQMDNVFSIVAVGKFEYRKGFDLLLQACNRLDGDYKVYFVGASDIEQYKRYISKNNEKHIEFVDFCDQNTLKKYYRAAELMILPTRKDVWGLVILEAMANGLVVVTTDQCLAGVALLEKNELISIDNVDAIIGIVKKYMSLSKDALTKIGQENIEKVRKYSIEEATKNDVVNLEKWMQN